MRTIHVGTDGFRGRTNKPIQDAVDAMAKQGGGLVVIPRGTYTMIDALHLRSGVHLRGEPGAILKNAPNIEMKVPNHVGYGMYEFVAAEPRKLKVGMGVHLWDNKAFGFYTTVATILAIEGNRVLINRPLAHDYMGMNDAMVSTLHSVIEGGHVSDVTIEGLILDGNKEKITRELNGCRGGGVLLLNCNRVVMRGLEVRNYRGDAVGFQMCTDIVVERCNIHDNTGNGLHPGAGTVRYVMRDNDVHDNGGFGLFYCLRTSHSLCKANHLHHNGLSGISVGERDTHHRLEENIIEENGGPAVELRPPGPEGGYVTHWTRNTFRNNCKVSGHAEFVINDGVRDVILEGNLFEPRTISGEPFARPVEIKPGAMKISATDNVIDGDPQTPVDFVEPPARKDDAVMPWETAKPSPRNLAKVIGSAKNVKWSKPTKPEAAGPEALELNGARHLGIQRLSEWATWYATVST